MISYRIKVLELMSIMNGLIIHQLHLKLSVKMVNLIRKENTILHILINGYLRIKKTFEGLLLGTYMFFTYSTARRRRRLSGRHMYMFSRHRKLHFCKIISFISGLECLQKVR